MNHRMTAFLAVAVMVIAGLVAVSFIDDESEAIATGTATSPLTSVDWTWDSVDSSVLRTYYVKVGAPFKFTGDSITDDVSGMAAHITGVTSGYGLTFSNGSEDSVFDGYLGEVSGTVSKWGRFAVYVTGIADNVSGVVNGNVTLTFIAVGDVKQGESITVDTGAGARMQGFPLTPCGYSYSLNGGSYVQDNSTTSGGIIFEFSSDMKKLTITFTSSATLGTYEFYSLLEPEGVEETVAGPHYAVKLVKASNFTHTVKYSSNGGTGSMSDTVVTDTVNGNTSVTLAANSFVKSGYHFVGWKVGSTVYQPGEKVPVGANASVTATAQWEVNSLTIKTIPTQYSVAGKNVSFSVSVISEPSGASVTYSKSNVSSGLNVTINGSTITCSASSAGTYTFVLTASANGFQSDSRTVTVTVVPVLAFANTPAIGVIGN